MSSDHRTAGSRRMVSGEGTEECWAVGESTHRIDRSADDPCPTTKRCKYDNNKAKYPGHRIYIRCTSTVSHSRCSPKADKLP